MVSPIVVELLPSEWEVKLSIVVERPPSECIVELPIVVERPPSEWKVELPIVVERLPSEWIVYWAFAVLAKNIDRAIVKINLFFIINT